jgi:hypothetical protein
MRHVHRAKAFVSSVLTVRRLIYVGASLLAVVIVAAPIYIYFFKPHQTNQLEEAIKSLRFHPITPPTTLRAPGTIYVIDDDGEVESALCWADAKDLIGVMHKSPTETVDTQILRKATLNSSAKITESLKEQIKGDVIESVSFTLADVSVLEVSIANLRGLSAKLQAELGCGDEVVRYIHAGKHLCQGQQVLQATAKYTITNKREVTGEIAAKVNDAIRATIDPKASFDGKTVTSGEGLFYGMRLAPLCMALDDKGVAPPPKPRTIMARILNRIGL